MFVEYSLLPENAKVWIYPSSRKFYSTEIETIENKISHFIEHWKSEDENFKACFKFLYNRFIVLFADDATSPLKNQEIDASVAFILELQNTYNVDLLDKMNVCFKQGEYVQYKELKDFKKLLKTNTLTKKTLVFDNLITNKQDFDSFWEIPLEESWYQRFL